MGKRSSSERPRSPRTQPRLPARGSVTARVWARGSGRAAAPSLRPGGRACAGACSRQGPHLRRLLTAPHPASALTLPGARTAERAVAARARPGARGPGTAGTAEGARQASLGGAGITERFGECAGPRMGPVAGGAQCSGRAAQDPGLPLPRGTGGVGQVFPRGRGAGVRPGLVLWWGGPCLPLGGCSPQTGMPWGEGLGEWAHRLWRRFQPRTLWDQD